MSPGQLPSCSLTELINTEEKLSAWFLYPSKVEFPAMMERHAPSSMGATGYIWLLST